MEISVGALLSHTNQQREHAMGRFAGGRVPGGKRAQGGGGFSAAPRCLAALEIIRPDTEAQLAPLSIIHSFNLQM